MKPYLAFALCLWFACLWAVPVLAQPAQPPGTGNVKPILRKLALDEWLKLSGEPARITLRVQDGAPEAVVAELAKQSGVRVEMRSAPEDVEKVTLNIQNQTFWPALHEVSRVMHVEPQQWGAARTIWLDPQWPDLGKLVPLHPLASLRLIKIGTQRNIWLGLAEDDPRGDDQSLSLDLALLLDPKVDALRDGVQFDIKEAVDEKGNDLRGAPLNGGGSLWLRRFEIPLQRHPETGKKLARLRGTIKLMVVAKRERWEIPNVLAAKNVSKTVRGPLGEETWTLQNVEIVPTEAGPRYHAILRVVPVQPLVAEEATEEELQARQMVESSLRDWSQLVSLVDAAGRVYPFMEGVEDNGEGIIVPFAPPEAEDAINQPGPPARLIVDIATDVREVEIPFDIKDLPLP